MESLYTGEILHEMKDCDLDHFLPWSFVAHNQLWNLIPVEKNINRSKNDRLPELRLLPKMAVIQRQAIHTYVDFGGKVKALEDFCDLGIDTQTLLSLNDQEFLNLYNNTFVPMRQIAVNMGFETWHQKTKSEEGNVMKDSQCIFCNLGKDKEIIAENELAIAFYDGFPVNPGHALIIPKRHVASYFDLSMDECTAMQALLEVVQTKVEERFHPDGYNIGVNVNAAAGQSVFHVHMHLIPRFLGDVDNPKGGVRGVIPSKQKY